MSLHIGRTFVGHRIEDECPCPQEPCGLVDSMRAVDDCPHHSPYAAKTIRQGHHAGECPTEKEATDG